MNERAVFIKEIDKLPLKYLCWSVWFCGIFTKKTQNKYENETDGYKAMAADSEREQEAQEW